MSEQELLQLVRSIPDGQSATITLTNLAGDRTLLQGVYKESQAPFFFFLAPPGQIPETLDTSKQCPFASQGRSATDVNFVADIVDNSNGRALELVARKTVRAEELRQFFRVTLRTAIIIRFYPKDPDNNQQDWVMSGETVDISQSGVLAILPEECSDSDGLDFEIRLVNPSKNVFCTGRVIRSKRLKKDRWLTSFHFDEISSTDRDAIAKNCFAEQRRQLRDKGQTF
ncbi:MAG: PilZ domain-containing protein [Proteobacteria bacterium]|nr:PilZ domain-containing protein [Pseudomonadota bacterium]